MDPATAAGLVFAVIPLIISAFQKYEAVLQPFVAFRRNQKQARKFQSTLKIQQTAFRNECFLLLSAITRQQVEMLSNPLHSLWRDQDLAKQLGAYLDDSLETCLSTLDLMHGVFTEIDKETRRGFGGLLKTEVPHLLPVGLNCWPRWLKKISSNLYRSKAVKADTPYSKKSSNSVSPNCI
jgi:hypothetical protein